MRQLRTRTFELAERHALGNQRELAAALGLHESTLSKIRSGDRQIGHHFQEAALRLFARYGYGWSDLFWYEPAEAPSDSTPAA